MVYCKIIMGTKEVKAYLPYDMFKDLKEKKYQRIISVIPIDEAVNENDLFVQKQIKRRLLEFEERKQRIGRF